MVLNPVKDPVRSLVARWLSISNLDLNRTHRRQNRAVLQVVRTALSSLVVWLLVCQLVVPLRYGQVRAEVPHKLTAGNAGWFTQVARSLMPALSMASPNGAVWPVQAGNTITVFGPRRFVRSTGLPNQFVEQFSLPAGLTAPWSCTLHVQNGAIDGSKRVSSATVKHNGTDILTPGDLNQNVGSLNRTITLNDHNQLDVSLSSRPGSYLVITITSEAPPNQPPTVNAGPDQTLTVPYTATLDGTAADDGLPEGSSLDTIWTVVSGPGAVIFANVSDVDTTATFSSTGVYLLRLTASDSEFTVSDDILITVPTQPLCQVGDNFDDNAIDLAKWIQPASSPATVEEQNQRLEISPSLSATGYNGYVSAVSCDLTNKQVSVEAVQPTSNVCGAETYFTLRDASSSGNLIFVAKGCDTLGFFYYVGGVSSVVTVFYNPTQHRFWRISHRGATNTISWETSPDRLNWTVQRSLVSQFPLSNMTTELQAGTYAVVGAGKAIFDDVRYEEFSAADTSSISVKNPANGPTFLAPVSFHISTNSTALPGHKTKEDFLASILLGAVTGAPFNPSLNLAEPPEGGRGLSQHRR